MVDKRRFLIGLVAGALGGALGFWLMSSYDFNLWKFSLFGAIFGIIVAWIVQFIKK